MYNNFIGLNYEPSDEQVKLLETRTQNLGIPEHGYDHVRYGLPSGTIKAEKVQVEVDILIDHYFKHGYGTWPAAKLSPNFRKHVAKFRASLDLWEQFSTTKVFSKDEIYVRSLREKQEFTDLIAKSRATCLRAKSSETITDIEEEYYFDEYDGYNSIISERYLLHWDDTKEIDDVKYAFIPATKNRDDDFREYLNDFWEEFKLDEVDWPHEFDMIGAMKNTKMYDPIKKKSFLMREFWKDDIDINSPYFAKRTVVPTTPGHTRDTGVGDPSTILKVKQLNALARVISEKVPYSANAPGPVCNARLKRVLKKDVFLHLDFKKFGLTFPRRLMNIIIEKIEKSSGFDLTHLYIHSFTVEIDKECYATERGTMLGWLDAINSIAVTVILHNLSTKGSLNFDFITFNDDVEISKRCKEAHSETLELLKLAVLAEINSFDIPISMNKTYGSRASVFLERYAYYKEEYNLDMYKEQLTVDAYAKSLVTEFPWQAKMLFSAAEQWTKSEYARDRCIDTCPVEFRQDEIHLPLWAGGWYIRVQNGQDQSLVESDRLGIRLGEELGKFRPPKYATKRIEASKNDDICRKVNNNAFYSNSADMGRHILKCDMTLESLNEDLEAMTAGAETRADVFPGRDEDFVRSVLSAMNDAVRTLFDPGISRG